MSNKKNLAAAVTLSIITVFMGGTSSIFAASLTADGQASVPQEWKNQFGDSNAIYHATDISNNSLNLSGQWNTTVIGGYTEQAADITNNTISFENATISGRIYGSVSLAGGSFSNNKISIKNSNTSEDSRVYISGVYSAKGNASNNQIVIENYKTSDIVGAVFGAELGEGDAIGNSISLSGKNNVAWDFIGAGVGTGSAFNNKVEITGENTLSFGANEEIAGAKVNTGNADSNILSISGKNTINTNNLMAGWVFTSGNAVNNLFILQGENTFEKNTAHLAGGYTANGNAENNIVDISGTTQIIDSKIHGGYTASGNAVNNMVRIDGDGTISGEIYGAEVSQSGSANNNSLIILGNILTNNKETSSGQNHIYGGSAIQGNANNNTVSLLENSEAADTIIYGGYTDQGSASQNKIYLDNKAVTNTFIRGGYTTSGSAADNLVSIMGDTAITGSEIYGGVAAEGNAESNLVSIQGNNSIGNSEIFGGYSINGNANNNSLIVENAQQATDYDNYVRLRGGVSKNGDAANNTLLIKDSSLNHITNTNHVNTFFGGFSDSDNADKNTLAIINSEVSGTITAGQTDASDKTASDNLLVIKNSTVAGTTITGGHGFISSNNYVEIADSKFLGEIRGGESTSGDAKNNIVAIKNSTDDYDPKYYGSEIWGGLSQGGNAVGNLVSISRKSTVNGNIYGGQSENGNASNNIVSITDGCHINNVDGTNIIYGGRSENADASGNLVLIDSSEFAGTIYGGWAGKEANDNTIIIKGNSDIENAVLIGGHGGHGTYAKNNTLVLDGWSGKAESVEGFDNYSFQNIKDTSAPVLTVSSVFNIDENTNFNLSFAGDAALQKEQQITLIKVENNTAGAVDHDTTAHAGTALDIQGSVSSDGSSISFTAESISANSQTAIIGAGQAAAAAFLNNGSDLAADGLAQINRDAYGVNTFAAAYSTNSSFDSGIDLNGWNSVVGVGKNIKTTAGDLAWGVFYENGTGSHDTANSFDGSSFTAEGKAVYNGGGLAVRLTKDNGVYGEAGLRAGSMKNELSNALMDANGQAYGYKTESDYLSWHLGIGRTFKLTNGNELEAYARYYHSKLDGDSFTLSSGDSYILEDINSDRIRLGGRYQDNSNEAVKVYYGAAWEYEFSGESGGTANGYALEEASLQGSTFLGEVGLVMNNPGSPWTVEMSLQGYAGEREGIGGKAQAVYHF